MDQLELIVKRLEDVEKKLLRDCKYCLTPDNASTRGHVNCLKYLYESGFLLRKNTCHGGLVFGCLKCLKYLHENGIPWDKEACTDASAYGHLECLKYLHENGAPWDKESWIYASINGHVNCLKYLHENKCPLDKDICNNTIYSEQLESFKYL